ncbi:hypothetical protein HAX54_049231 [Datura stramonium]|uniref:Polygalacturonase n=1 Tax=Datura stramonium TaxID=4076 RepID=A0ABS8SVB1_DATST|nr:hypothetical protein [Datura stramonium]
MEGNTQILSRIKGGGLRRPLWISVLVLFTVIALFTLQINREYSIFSIPLDFIISGRVGLVSGSQRSCSDFFKQVAVPPRKVVRSIRDFGGIGDGKTSNTEAFQRAMEFMARFADSGGSQLVVPKGRWLTGSFNLTSNFTLFLQQGAVILGSQDPKEWPLINALPSYGRGRERLGARHISLIHGNGLSNVVITGNFCIPIC